MKRLAVGLLAHVDAGKTTLCEAMLYRAGEIRKLGRVDHGDAFLDNDALEKERGITIFSKQARLRLRRTEVTLLDTPGHVDFSAEAERTLQVLDAAVLVISGSEGVQSHTETLWRLLARYRVPTFIFVNKMDLPGADADAVARQLRERLHENCLPVQLLPGAFPAPLRPQALEAMALCDEALLEACLAGADTAAVDEALAGAVAARRVFPCLYGSALRCEGVDVLLDALERWLPAPPAGDSFAAQVYKIGADEQGTRLTFLKVTGGTLRTRMLLATHGQDAPEKEKVTGIRLYAGARYRAVEEAPAGTVCAISGPEHTRPGQGLGAQPDAPAPLLEPVLCYRVRPRDPARLPQLHDALLRLAQQDPQLHVAWQKDAGEIQLQLMGEVQREVLARLLAERSGLEVDFDAGSILYRETILQPVEGVGHYEPLRHYAEVHLLLEPLPPGSGLQFATRCREDDLAGSWQRLILTHLAERTHPGVLTGAPITDMRISLLAGRAHPKHTEGGDFRQATYRAVRQGLRSAACRLLEPWYDFRLRVPAECVGRAMTDMEQRGAACTPLSHEREEAVLAGSAPAAVLQGYAAVLAAYTRGRGQLTCTPAGYRPCHNEAQVIAAAGYDPDADIANPADSVFCAHGAGFVVRWDEAPRRMHVQTGWGKKAPPAPAAPAAGAPDTRAARYRGTLEEDKELLAIFERTYGPIRRRSPLPPLRPTAQLLREEAEAAAGAVTDYLLVDGYNMLFAWEDLHALAKEDLAAARGRLMDILCNYHGWQGGELILVFDAYRVPGGTGDVQQYHGIYVVYTREAETADMFIEKATRSLGARRRVRVATSDGLEQLIILGHGALRISAEAFRAEVDAAEAAIRACLSE